MTYRVDNVPFLWRPLWLAASWIGGALAFLQFLLLRWTCRFRVEGREHLPAGGAIYCFWHEGLWVWFTMLAPHPRRLVPRRRQVWMQHPAAYMKPVHVVLRMLGIDFVLGSKGEEGRAAVDTVARAVAAGDATMVAPDGPGGPPRVLKKGVLHMAAKSGAPIVPIRFEARPAIRQRAWDRKLTPLPFARITIRYGTPLWIDGANLDDVAKLLEQQLG